MKIIKPLACPRSLWAPSSSVTPVGTSWCGTSFCECVSMDMCFFNGTSFFVGYELRWLMDMNLTLGFHSAKFTKVRFQTRSRLDSMVVGTPRPLTSWPTSPFAASRTPPPLHEPAVITLVLPAHGGIGERQPMVLAKIPMKNGDHQWWPHVLANLSPWVPQGTGNAARAAAAAAAAVGTLETEVGSGLPINLRCHDPDLVSRYQNKPQLYSCTW